MKEEWKEGRGQGEEEGEEGKQLYFSSYVHGNDIVLLSKNPLIKLHTDQQNHRVVKNNIPIVLNACSTWHQMFYSGVLELEKNRN